MATAAVHSSHVPVAPHRHRLTVDEFHRMGEAGILQADQRAELIDGEVFDTSPIGRLHAALVARLTTAFHESLGRSVVIWTQNPVRLGAMSEPRPDIALLAPRDDFYGGDAPTAADVRLIVEVADSSLEHDLAAKVPLYAAHGIPEVWVIETTSRRTHRFSRPANGGHADRAIVEPDAPLGFGGFNGSLANLLPPAR
jgi:Uma2 family endonuclease